jgi:hypothetical protein
MWWSDTALRSVLLVLLHDGLMPWCLRLEAYKLLGPASGVNWMLGLGVLYTVIRVSTPL